MSLVNLVGYQVNKYSFENSLANGTKVSMQTKYSYNVKFAESNHHCKGEFTCELCDKENPDKFSLKLTLTGIFTYKADAEKASIHVDSFKALFPYARTYVAMVTAAGGIPPVNLPDIDIEKQSIYSFQKPTS